MRNALKKLSEIEGMSVNEMLEEGVYDSVCWGVCTNEDCNYTAQVEPDGSGYRCPECDTLTVQSACILAGII